MGALIPLALSIAPEMAKWLFGATAAKTTTAIADAVQVATGTSDPEMAAAILERNPDAAGQLRIQLAQIAADQESNARSAELTALAANLRDTADARSQTIALSSQKTAIAWSAPVVSAAVLVTFGAVMGLVLIRTVPPGSETIVNMLLGTLAAMANSVVSYWVGSSAGSARKEEQIAQAGRVTSGQR